MYNFLVALMWCMYAGAMVVTYTQATNKGQYFKALGFTSMILLLATIGAYAVMYSAR